MYIPKSLHLNTFEQGVEVSPRKLFSERGAQPLGKPDYQAQDPESAASLIPVKEFNNLKEQIKNAQINTRDSMRKAIEYFSEKTGQEFPDLLKDLDSIFV